MCAAQETRCSMCARRATTVERVCSHKRQSTSRHSSMIVLGDTYTSPYMILRTKQPPPLPPRRYVQFSTGNPALVKQRTNKGKIVLFLIKGDPGSRKLVVCSPCWHTA